MVGAQRVLEVGLFGEDLQRGREQARGRLLTGGEQERGRADDRNDVGGGSVRVGREGEVGQHVFARRAAPVLDVLREPVVEPSERVEVRFALRSGADRTGCRAQAEAFAEPAVVGFRYPEQIGHDEHRERLRVRADELAAAVGDELVELLIGEAPHERLVVLEPPRRDQPHERARSCVCIGGSIVTMCSFIGSWSRWPSMMAPTSSPSSGTGNVTNGPMTELHDEKVSTSR